MEKYIRLNKMTYEKFNEVKDALTNIGVSFDIFDYATEAFFEEEAKMRLTIWEECNPNIDIDNELRNEILYRLQDKYLDNEYVINGELLDEITDEEFSNIVDVYEERNNADLE